MTVVVRLILRFPANVHKKQDDAIRHEIRQRMNGIGHHRGTMPHEACHKFEEQQHHVDCSSNDRNLIYFFVTFHVPGPYLLLGLLANVSQDATVNIQHMTVDSVRGMRGQEYGRTA